MTSRAKEILVGVLAAALVVVLVVAVLVWTNKPQPAPLAAVDSASIRDAVVTENVVKHLDALQKVADENGGNRASGSPGYEASLDYVKEQLKLAGFTTEQQEFTYPRETTAVTMARTQPTASTFVEGRDFRSVRGSGEGAASGRVRPVDLGLEGGRENSSACEASDFEGFAQGDIALVQRGRCTFSIKVKNAMNAGASAVIVMNQGDAPDRSGLFDAGLNDGDATIPVLATTFDVGAELAGASAALDLSVERTNETVTTWNLLAETAGNPDQTIVVGAHLDGVAQGPGINDNGSGVAAVLETAVQFGRLGVQPASRVRFAFWGGEEDGLFGSYQYVADQKDAGRSDALYLNLDMVGSPNPVPYVYRDADWPEGSATISTVLEDFLVGEGVPPEPISFDASDHHPFAQAGIPIGGLHTGSYEVKTDHEAEQYGGDAGEPLDPCYHESCDRLDSIDHTMLGLMADAVAHATLAFAQSSEPIR